eukprot:Clim_evm4s207 gene=Clim_evmTU4s207
MLGTLIRNAVRPTAAFAATSARTSLLARSSGVATANSVAMMARRNFAGESYHKAWRIMMPVEINVSNYQDQETVTKRLRTVFPDGVYQLKHDAGNIQVVLKDSVFDSTFYTMYRELLTGYYKDSDVMMKAIDGFLEDLKNMNRDDDNFDQRVVTQTVNNHFFTPELAPAIEVLGEDWPLSDDPDLTATVYVYTIMHEPFGPKVKDVHYGDDVIQHVKTFQSQQSSKYPLARFLYPIYRHDPFDPRLRGYSEAA